MPFSVVRGRVITDSTGVSVDMPVLMGPDGPVLPLVDYCLSVHRSLAWQEKLIRAAKLFLEYLEVNTIRGEEEWRIFRNFSYAILNGTIDRETQEDPSGLYWAGIDVRDANFMITQLSDWFEWMGFEESQRAAKFNPLYQGNDYDKKIRQKAYEYRRSKAFLGHAWSGKPRVSQARLIRGERQPKVFPKQPPKFPEENFEELLLKGFNVAGKYDYRDILITLLMFGGGLRVSEPFHLYMADVQPHWEDPSVAFVAVHHPSLGNAPNHWKNNSGHRGSRREYLSANFGLPVRNLSLGMHHAGWKHPALDDHWFMQVHWFPEEYGRWFLRVWERYLSQVSTIPRSHPYAWINTDQNVGGAYTIKQYEKKLQRAVERIGLVYGKSYGTTAHGFRHAYAKRAQRGGIDPILIQRMMHHCSPDSQMVYTQPEVRETIAAIRSASQILRDSHSKIPSVIPLII